MSKEAINVLSDWQQKNTEGNLEQAMLKINSRFGKKIVRGSEWEYYDKRLATGIQDLDKLLNGGWPIGINVISGPEMSGKTAIVSWAIKAAADLGIPTFCAFPEGTPPIKIPKESPAIEMRTPYYGYNDLLFGIKDFLHKTGSGGLVVIDSINALTCLADQNTYLELSNDEQIGREQSDFVRILNLLANQYYSVVLITAQTRSRMTGVLWEERPAIGNALGFFAKFHLNLKNITDPRQIIHFDQRGEPPIFSVKVIVEKTKVSLNGCKPNTEYKIQIPSPFNLPPFRPVKRFF